MPSIGMKQITSGRKLAYPTVASRAASVTAMLWVGPELARDMTRVSRKRRAPERRPPPPAWSRDCAPAGAGPLLAGDDMAHLRLGQVGFSARGGERAW